METANSLGRCTWSAHVVSLLSLETMLFDSKRAPFTSIMRSLSFNAISGFFSFQLWTAPSLMSTTTAEMPSIKSMSKPIGSEELRTMVTEKVEPGPYGRLELPCSFLESFGNSSAGVDPGGRINGTGGSTTGGGAMISFSAALGISGIITTSLRGISCTILPSSTEALWGSSFAQQQPTNMANRFAKADSVHPQALQGGEPLRN
mmetsp:Transcript_104475/g.261932  ORF Transcript_104475/g.261932 Transcript_104475/m.261932 type:complete len:204 (+) Transcript_104475:474-1085(+)